MHIFISKEQRETLLNQHRTEKNGKIRDRIKSVLLSDQGWTYRSISEALFLDEETISTHVREFRDKAKLRNNSGGSSANLSVEQSDSIVNHIESSLYLESNIIRLYVENTYDVKFSKSGMVSWLHDHDFSYKKPNRVPAKADKSRQELFIEMYDTLKSELGKDDVMLFGDGVHPSMETKVTSGWIRTGKHKELKTTASRTRLNILGALELDNMNLLTKDYKTINSDSVIDFMEQLKEAYLDKEKIHFIVDNGPYYTSNIVKQKAVELGITMVYLPPYSPNLNPIERLWKYMNEKVRNNVFFHSAKDFKQQILSFFTDNWDKNKVGLEDRINDNFQRLKSAF
jgi:transposase